MPDILISTGEKKQVAEQTTFWKIYSALALNVEAFIKSFIVGKTRNLEHFDSKKRLKDNVCFCIKPNHYYRKINTKRLHKLKKRAFSQTLEIKQVM